MKKLMQVVLVASLHLACLLRSTLVTRIRNQKYLGENSIFMETVLVVIDLPAIAVMEKGQAVQMHLLVGLFLEDL